jgi:hypothetical protein
MDITVSHFGWERVAHKVQQGLEWSTQYTSIILPLCSLQ